MTRRKEHRLHTALPSAPLWKSLPRERTPRNAQRSCGPQKANFPNGVSRPKALGFQVRTILTLNCARCFSPRDTGPGSAEQGLPRWYLSVKQGRALTVLSLHCHTLGQLTHLSRNVPKKEQSSKSELSTPLYRPHNYLICKTRQRSKHSTRPKMLHCLEGLLPVQLVTFPLRTSEQSVRLLRCAALQAFRSTDKASPLL